MRLRELSKCSDKDQRTLGWQNKPYSLVCFLSASCPWHTGPGLFPPTQSTLPYSLVSFLLSAVLVPPTSPKYPNHSSLYSAQNELCKAGASQLVLVLLMLFLSKCLVKSVQVCQSCFSKQTTSLVRTPCVLLVLKSPTEMTPRDIFILI